MKVNYVLLYGTPYLRYKLFDTFKKMSDFIVKKCIVNYTIFEKMEDKKEVEMIYRDSDISVLEKENKELKDRIDKAIEYIENTIITIYDNKYTKINSNHYVDDLLNILRGNDDEN